MVPKLSYLRLPDLSSGSQNLLTWLTFECSLETLQLSQDEVHQDVKVEQIPPDYLVTFPDIATEIRLQKPISIAPWPIRR